MDERTCDGVTMTSDKTEEAFDTLRVLHTHSELMLSLTLNADQHPRLTHESQDAGPLTSGAHG